MYLQQVRAPERERAFQRQPATAFFGINIISIRRSGKNLLSESAFSILNHLRVEKRRDIKNGRFC